MGGELYQEVRALLESSQVILPPFVSSKVIMLAQQWVEGAPAPAQEGVEEASVSSGQGESQNTITLPGGAVLVARPAQGGGGASPRPAISQEAPDVSITLGAKTQPPTPPTEGPPARVLASLAALALPLACLPSLLAVYREVRDSYKGLVMADYLVSWTQLVTARLRSAGLMASEPAGRAG